jgi:hypothetical protein
LYQLVKRQPYFCLKPLSGAAHLSSTPAWQTSKSSAQRTASARAP